MSNICGWYRTKDFGFQEIIWIPEKGELQLKETGELLLLGKPVRVDYGYPTLDAVLGASHFYGTDFRAMGMVFVTDGEPLTLFANHVQQAYNKPFNYSLKEEN